MNQCQEEPTTACREESRLGESYTVQIRNKVAKIRYFEVQFVIPLQLSQSLQQMVFTIVSADNLSISSLIVLVSSLTVYSVPHSKLC